MTKFPNPILTFETTLDPESRDVDEVKSPVVRLKGEFRLLTSENCLQNWQHVLLLPKISREGPKESWIWFSVST